ncbi:MAG: PilZ domain-containing protein [Chromatiales bacterium]|nr:PilZ domain-containing protein [Chromatiales bacterium]
MPAHDRRSQRGFMRHPSNIPIEVVSDPKNRLASQLHDVSHGGLSYQAGEPRRPGEVVRLRMPLIAEDVETPARVVWCRPNAQGYQIGVEFLREEDAYRARMIEQLCHIEQYRQAVLQREGRRLDSQQAALEWIAKYASRFPAPAPPQDPTENH